MAVLSVLAEVPCLVEHPDIKPYVKMVNGHGLGLDLPQQQGAYGEYMMATWGHYPMTGASLCFERLRCTAGIASTKACFGQSTAGIAPTMMDSGQTLQT